MYISITSPSFIFSVHTMFHIIKAWVRGVQFENFAKGKYVSISFNNIVDYSGYDLNQIKEITRQRNPSMTKQQVAMTAGQIYRFNNIQKDDHVITYDPSQREYRIGIAIGVLSYHASDDAEEGASMRQWVEWKWSISRDVLPVYIKNTLWSISTVFNISDDMGSAMMHLAKNPQSPVVVDTQVDEQEPIEEIRDNLVQQAKELIQDKISALSWSEMQDLVAWLLRAMGYKTKVSPPWPDGGKDIVATKDGFGFEDPTIIVEVKHRKESMSRPLVQQLVGVIRSWQKWLYVSTGGFTREAIDLVRQQHHHIVLLDLEQLSDLVVEYYESFDVEWKTLLPLSRIYRPV